MEKGSGIPEYHLFYISMDDCKVCFSTICCDSWAPFQVSSSWFCEEFMHMDGRWHIIALIIAFVIYFLHHKFLTMRKKSTQNYRVWYILVKISCFGASAGTFFYNTLVKTSHSYIQRWTKYFCKCQLVNTFGKYLPIVAV